MFLHNFVRLSAVVSRPKGVNGNSAIMLLKFALARGGDCSNIIWKYLLSGF